MSEAIETTKVHRLCKLHEEIIGSAVKTLQAAIEAGQILTEIKQELPHGDFTPWCEENLPFNMRTAQRYMRCYALRDRLLKNDSVSLLGAYRLLKKPKEKAGLSTWPLMLKEMREWLREGREYLSLMRQAQEMDDPLHYLVALVKDRDINEGLHEKMRDREEDFQKLLDDSQVEDIKHLSEAVETMRQVQNTLSVITIYWEREIGRVLNELESKWPEMYEAYTSGNKKEQQRLMIEIEGKIAEAELSMR